MTARGREEQAPASFSIVRRGLRFKSRLKMMTN